MAKNRKTVRKSFTYLQCDDFAAYLSQMAAEGWHFKEWKFGLVFEKGEPENAVYAVEVFINGTDYDMRPGDHTLNFAEYCEAAGWKLVDARAKFCIFKQIRTDAVDILTQEERLKNAAAAYGKNLRIQAVMAIMWLFNLCLRLFPIYSFIETIFSGMDLAFAVYSVFFFIYIVSKIIWFCVWKQKARKRCAAGETKILCDANETPWNLGSLVLASIAVTGVAITADIWVIGFMIALVALTLLMNLLLNKFRPDATTNFGITIAFTVFVIIAAFAAAIASVDYAPKSDVPTELVSQLYKGSSGEIGALQNTFYTSSFSAFGAYQRCHLTYEDADFSYDLYETEQDWLLDIVWDHESSKTKNVAPTDCTSLWNTEAAFQNHAGQYYVRCENKILILDLGENRALTAQQVAAIRSALGLE